MTTPPSGLGKADWNIRVPKSADLSSGKKIHIKPEVKVETPLPKTLSPALYANMPFARAVELFKQTKPKGSIEEIDGEIVLKREAFSDAEFSYLVAKSVLDQVSKLPSGKP